MIALPARAAAPAPSRRELVVLLLYFGGAVFLADLANVRLGIELLTTLVLVAALIITRRPRAFLRDWWFFLIGLILWNLSGPIAAQSPFPAHVHFMLDLDQVIFGGHQPVQWLQDQLGHQVMWLTVLASVAYNMHLSEPYIAGYFLWRLRPDVYYQFAAAVLLLLVAGFVTFIVFPAVPPWLAGRKGLLPGVVNLFAATLHVDPIPFRGTPLFALFHFRGDAVAAFPSEHAAFPLLELLAFTRISRAGWWLAIWVAVVTFSVVYLGQHWVTDVLAGWLYALTVTMVVRQVTGTGLAPSIGIDQRRPENDQYAADARGSR